MDAVSGKRSDIWLRCITILVVLLGFISANSAYPQPDRSAPEAEDMGEEKLRETFAEKADIEVLEQGQVQLGEVTIWPDERKLTFPAEINQLSKKIEPIITTMEGRTHETLLRTEAHPLHLQLALYLLGLDNGARLPDQDNAQGDLVDIDLEWKTEEGKQRKTPIEQWVVDKRTGDKMERNGWVFVGSGVRGDTFLAEKQGNLALVWSVGETVLDIADPESVQDSLFEVEPPPAAEGVQTGDKVTVIVTPRAGVEG